MTLFRPLNCTDTTCRPAFAFEPSATCSPHVSEYCRKRCLMIQAVAWGVLKPSMQTGIPVVLQPGCMFL